MWTPMERLTFKMLQTTEYYQIYNKLATKAAARLLTQDKVIALPTDTIYGIAALAQSKIGIEKIYKIKKRDEIKPIAICVSDIYEISKWGDTAQLPKGIIKELLPGKITLVLKRKNILNHALNPQSELVGIRVPDCKFIRDVTKICGVPLALTSANLSNEPSTLHPNEFINLWPSLGGVFDGGKLDNTDREGSTVVDLSVPTKYKILRNGSVYHETICVLQKYGLTSFM